MENENLFADITILPRTLGLAPEQDARETREMLIMRAGDHLLGLFADEADHVSKATIQPTPLPRAPSAILGIAAVRGRVRTVIDPTVLLTNERDAMRRPDPADAPPPSFIVSLRGDEQIALLAHAVERVIKIYTDTIKPTSHAGAFVRGVVQHDGALVIVLDPQQIFAAATTRMERRRQRTKQVIGNR